MPSQVIVPHSLRIAEVLTVALGFGLSTFAVCARIYTKLRIARKFLLEDYFSIAAYLGFLAYLGLAIVIGKNTGDVQHKAYLSTVETIVYDPTIVLIKTSILLQYVTIFVAHRRNLFHIGCHVFIWVIVIFYFIATFLYIFQMPSTEKARFFFVFGIGLFACVASVVRLVYSFQLDPGVDGAEYQLKIDKEGLWAFAEIAIGIIVGCMPHVHKFLRHFSSKIPITSSFRLLSGTSGRSSWRRLLGNSSTSKASSSRKISGSKGSGSVAPHIGTLNMTHASFSSAENELLRRPSRIYAEDAIRREPLPQATADEQCLSGKLDVGQEEMSGPEQTFVLDAEAQAPSPTYAWQQQQCKPEDRRNETRRAHYDLYSRT